MPNKDVCFVSNTKNYIMKKLSYFKVNKCVKHGKYPTTQFNENVCPKCRREKRKVSSVPIINGCYYMVQTTQNGEHEPASVFNMESTGLMFFKFSNGSVIECGNAVDYRSMN